MNFEINDRFTFGNLNFVRKAYLIVLWLVNITISGLITYGLLTSGNDLTLNNVSILVVIFIFTLWNHTAIVNRRLNQLKLLAFLNFIPFASLLNALICGTIMLHIVQITKDEIQSTGR